MTKKEELEAQGYKTFMSFLLLAGCGNNQKGNNMAITVNLRYTGADIPETDNQFIRQ